MMAGRLIARRIALVMALAGAYLALGASPAAAGQLLLDFNAGANSGFGSGCKLWAMSPAPGFLYDPPCSGYPLGVSADGAVSFGAGARFSFQITAPPGVAINDAYVIPDGQIYNINNGAGWGGGSFYQGGAGLWKDGQTYEQDTGISSSYWGFAMICGWSQCGNAGSIYLDEINLVATENTGPSLTAIGGNNLWYQGSHWIWNPPGDPWPLTLDSQDVSGVCGMTAYVGSGSPPLSAPPSWDLTSQWQQCEERTGSSEWAPTVDTASYVPTAGALPLSINATNAAGVTSGVSETLSVDNDPVTVSLSTPNDSNPSVWVNHAVTVDATPSAGPSGVGGMRCSVDGGAQSSYPAGGLTVDGTGAHTATCTAWNNAVDPQGANSTGSASVAIRIDESPPSMGFEPQNPSAPSAVVVDASDKESGVAGGSIAIAPAGTENWTNLPTSFDGHHLVAEINDAALKGQYVIRASSCDNVGNCRSTSETLTLPLRLEAVSAVSFEKIAAPAVVVTRRVLVGWHWRRLRINGTLVRVRIGGHWETVRVVIARNALCVHKRLRTGPHAWTEVRICRALKMRLVHKERVGYGKPVTLHGVLVTAQGAPVARAPVRILVAPSNGSSRFAPAATVTTASNGAWSITLRAGPSRTIAAEFAGSRTLLPATGKVTVTVPARVELSIEPRASTWGGTITVSGRVEGGYVPPSGELVVLWVGWRGGSTEIGHVYTDRGGQFQTPYTFLRGNGTENYKFWVTTARESDYPWAPGRSARIAVRVRAG